MEDEEWEELGYFSQKLISRVCVCVCVSGHWWLMNDARNRLTGFGFSSTCVSFSLRISVSSVSFWTDDIKYFILDCTKTVPVLSCCHQTTNCTETKELLSLYSTSKSKKNTVMMHQGCNSLKAPPPLSESHHHHQTLSSTITLFAERNRFSLDMAPIMAFWEDQTHHGKISVDTSTF